MRAILEPWHILVLALASMVNREQQEVIEYLKAENRVLKEQLKTKGGRVRYTDAQRRLLASKAKELGRAALRKLDTIVRMARENPRWGYTRIRGAVWNLGHDVSRTTVANVLERHGIDPAPSRKTTWRQFLCAHWDVIAATDFFAVEVFGPAGLVRYHVLFVIELATRKVQIAGIISQPHGAWMEQVARNLTDALDGFLLGKRYLILDRDPLFTANFRKILRASGTKPLRLPARSPNLNAWAERFVLSIRRECLNHVILFGEYQLRRVVNEFVAHYQSERNHQGLDNRLIDGRAANDDGSSSIQCRKRLGGMLRYYHRRAA